MACVLHIRVPARFLRLATRLLARLAIGILAVAWPMTEFAAMVGSTTQQFSANLAATDILEPTLLVLEFLLAAHAVLLDQERALRTCLVVLMAVVRDLRMAAGLRSVAGVPTRWRIGTAR